jgi:glycosyltransferase involved in cell wall biosynthesis
MIGGNTNRINNHSSNVILIDVGIRMHRLKDTRPVLLSILIWLIKSISIQLIQSIYLIRLRKRVNLVIFSMAYPYMLIPLFISKLLRLPAMELVTRGRPSSAIGKIMRIQDPLLFRLLDGMPPESNSLIMELNLDNYKHKLLPIGLLPIDFNKFRVSKKYSERRKVIVFISRLIREKGTVEFVKSIYIVSRKLKNSYFIIGGDGKLIEWVRKEASKLNNSHGARVQVVGWIGEDLPDYLNEAKLLVLPTFEEGLPRIVCESMACGTPVLAYSSGGIRDIIKDGETGFILSSIDPIYIGNKVVELLSDDSLLNKVSEDAQRKVYDNFNHRVAKKNWIRILTLMSLAACKK